MSHTIPVRKGEELDYEAVRQFLVKNFEDIPNEHLEIQQFPAGKSNLTYVIRCGCWEAVLRRPPFGPLPPKAHDMKREYEVINKLYSGFPLVPKPYLYCSDKGVIGAPFYIMERVKGITLDDDPNKENDLNVIDKQHISYLMVDAIVDLHQVDYKKAGLENIGYPNSFIERQLKNWITRYQKYKTDDIAVVDKVINWLINHLPHSNEATLIHNDFKINNVLLSDDLKQINAILDWEMATIGDPLFDLGATLSYWLEENDSELIKESLIMPTAQKGFISRREFLERYAKKTGRDVSSFQFYMTLAFFKIAVAVQQMYYRYTLGHTKDERFANLNSNVKNIMLYAEIQANRKI
ncbi:phosphotransferase family protein [Neobacillus sp. SAB-20_R2A]|uniref:phosphotransferase family protein n=1 Tax=Neobacillus sp. SAB-20_R2A TaxID=3120519 RepID=UPI003C6E5815